MQRIVLTSSHTASKRLTYHTMCDIVRVEGGRHHALFETGWTLDSLPCLANPGCMVCCRGWLGRIAEDHALCSRRLHHSLGDWLSYEARHEHQSGPDWWMEFRHQLDCLADWWG